MPQHSAPAIVWKDAAVKIPVSHAVHLPSSPFTMYKTDTNSLSATLTRLVKENTFWYTVSVNSYHHSRQPVFNWQFIANQWKEVFKNFSK